MADSPITTGVTSLGSSGADVLMTLLAARFIECGRNRGGPLRFIMNVSSEFGEPNQTLRIPVAPEITSKLRTDGGAIELEDDPGSTVELTLNRPRYTAFGHTDIARALAGDANAAMLLDSHIKGMLDGIEEDVLSCITSGITTNTVGTYASAVTEANIVAAINKLYDSKVPGEEFVGLFRHGTYAWGALVQIANFTQANTSGMPNPTFQQGWGNGRLWNNVRFWLTQALPLTGTYTDNIIMHPSAIAMAMRAYKPPECGGVEFLNVSDPLSGLALQILKQWDPVHLARQYVVQCLYGYAVVKEDWACLYKS